MHEIKRILLVDPPVTRPKEYSASKMRVSPFFPLGLGYLAAVLKAIGYEVAILDCLIEGIDKGERAYEGGMLRYGLSDEEISAKIREWHPDIVGVSCIFSAKDFDAKNICRLSKKIFPQTPTVVGGPHAGAACREMMAAEGAIDFIIIGEGEASFPSLILAIQTGRGTERVDGLCYRTENAICKTDKTIYIENLDSLPFPDRDSVGMSRYLDLGYAHDRFMNRPFTQVITSRGCPFKCTFCALGNHWGAAQRRRSAGNVLAEIDVLVNRYGVREIHFEDDNLTADKGRAMEIFSGLKARRYGITWTVPTGMAVSSLDEDLLASMAQSGCYSVTLGVESGSQFVVSKLMRKPVDLKRVPGLVKAIRNNGMLAKGFFILGYPGETKDTLCQTVEFAKSLELDWTFFFIATPLPHTEMYNTALRDGYIQLGDFNPLTSLHDSVIRSPEFDAEYLSELRERAIVDLNFRNNPNLRKYSVDQAIADFRHVLDLYPHFDFAHEAMGDALQRKSDVQGACEHWRRAIQLNPGNAIAAQRLQDIASTGKNNPATGIGTDEAKK